jgi:hypothetical protein
MSLDGVLDPAVVMVAPPGWDGGRHQSSSGVGVGSLTLIWGYLMSFMIMTGICAARRLR